MTSSSGLGLVPFLLDGMKFIFAKNNVVTTEDTTIAELIKSVLEGAAVDSEFDTDCNNESHPQSVTLVTSALAITAVDNAACVPWEFGALP